LLFFSHTAHSSLSLSQSLYICLHGSEDLHLQVAAELTFLNMASVASTPVVFAENPATHTIEVVEGLLNPTFCNALEVMVTVQVLLTNDFGILIHNMNPHVNV